MNDILTIIWKESKDLFFQGGRSDLIRPLVFVGIVGILLPWRQGISWLSLPAIAIFVIIYIPFITISTFISDVIAGERERHTLETLLASRIPSSAILLGKVIVTVAYCWGIAILGVLVGWVTVNLLAGQATWQFYSPLSSLVAVLILSLLAALLAASLGTLISLRTATVRQAAQIMALGTLVLFILGAVTLQAIPASTLAALSAQQLFFIIAGILVLLDAILLGIALAAFRRSRLLLS